MQLALSSKLVFNTCIKDKSTETTLNFEAKADLLSRKHQPLPSLHQKNLHGFSLHLVHVVHPETRFFLGRKSCRIFPKHFSDQRSTRNWNDFMESFIASAGEI